ncbi:CD3324 family protein [Oceanirhabdus seepicola]|uniref:Mor transcription activator domain-containing protein n=1 Tax=Oceanirhabdus seepicola TaxID=2828781 RepID=A0A9J6P0E2_9CLOT|nr:CD3324 family protein [Oceanirhabdus seepicola]MCM1988896.1 hypothetical protein [Oceanirhabdus seepicola]
MGYIKACKVLPQELVALIQDYVDGEYLYIPRKKGNEKSWGEANGTKENIVKRNREIYYQYCSGVKADALAERYYLSEKTIRKIVSIEKQDAKQSVG